MEIRRFQPSDADALSEMIDKTLHITNRKDYSAEILDEVAEKHSPEELLKKAERTHLYVAEEEGRIIGSGAIGLYQDRPDESCMYTIYVDPEYQGKGIGRKIMEILEEDEYCLQSKRIIVPASITATEFYRSLGYDYLDGKKELDENQLYQLVKYR